MGLLNTYWVLILPYIAGGQAFAIFVLRSFIASQPEEIFESARIDGAGEFTIYRAYHPANGQTHLRNLGDSVSVEYVERLYLALRHTAQPRIVDYLFTVGEFQQPMVQFTAIWSHVRWLCNRIDPAFYPLRLYHASLHRGVGNRRN